jgi:5,10-methylenetetrahydrofolate reductase
VPIIPGIMPIQTYSSFTRITKLCGARVPDSLAEQLASIGASRSKNSKVANNINFCVLSMMIKRSKTLE